MAYIGKEPAYGNLVKQTLTPNGVTTNFALDYYVSTAASLIVSVGGVVQSPDVSYTITGGGNQITFDEAPASGLDVFLIYLGVQNLINTPATGTVTTTTIADYNVTSSKIANSAVTTATMANYNVTSVKMSNTGVTAATYGNASSIASFTVDAAGRITSASNVSLSVSSSGSDIYNSIALGAL